MIKRGEIETVHFTDAVNENANPCQHARTVPTGAKLFAHVLAHLAYQSFRQVDTGPARSLGEELSVIDSNHHQQTSVHTGRSADSPFVGDR